MDTAIVDWSNQIHRQLKETASRHETLRQRIAQLPMFARYQVAGCRVDGVHGDADSLEFLAQWPAGTAAWLFYFQRIVAGPAFTPPQALATV
ncbi:MAG: hypothetical protein ABI696_17715 [Rubrivivax sp.]